MEVVETDQIIHTTKLFPSSRLRLVYASNSGLKYDERKVGIELTNMVGYCILIECSIPVDLISFAQSV